MGWRRSVLFFIQPGAPRYRCALGYWRGFGVFGFGFRDGRDGSRRVLAPDGEGDFEVWIVACFGFLGFSEGFLLLLNATALNFQNLEL
jgi:hypothetical protein